MACCAERKKRLNKMTKEVQSFFESFDLAILTVLMILGFLSFGYIFHIVALGFGNAFFNGVIGFFVILITLNLALELKNRLNIIQK